MFPKGFLSVSKRLPRGFLGASWGLPGGFLGASWGGFKGSPQEAREINLLTGKIKFLIKFGFNRLNLFLFHKKYLDSSISIRFRSKSSKSRQGSMRRN